MARCWSIQLSKCCKSRLLNCAIQVPSCQARGGNLWSSNYFHNVRHPSDIDIPEVEAFLTHLTLKENLAASTQNPCAGRSEVRSSAPSCSPKRGVDPAIHSSHHRCHELGTRRTLFQAKPIQFVGNGSSLFGDCILVVTPQVTEPSADQSIPHGQEESTRKNHKKGDNWRCRKRLSEIVG